ncbi:MAG: N-acetylneuraminate synthase family protein [Deltaproteobacteria bacterium]|nr:N-acetylneuraminate synthase family protein [Deltaproteobacteria bacterium]
MVEKRHGQTGNTFFIANRRIGEGERSFIIAEVAQSHEGSLGMAHAFIDAAAEAGADAIKFQTHIASEESTIDEPFRIKFSEQDKNRYDYWKRMEFTAEQWAGLSRHAGEKGIFFLSSVFSVKAVEMLQRIGMPAWKIGSGEVRSVELLEAISKNGAPILLSTGMSDFEEIDRSVEMIQEKGLDLAVFQCTSMYPTPFEKVGLNVIDQFMSRYQCPIGLSDHSGTIFPGLAAMVRGIHLLEVHVTFDKAIFGPDIVASITFKELKFLAEARDAFGIMRHHPVDKDNMALELSDTRAIFLKSVAPARHLKTGTILDKEMLTLKKPGTGIQVEELHRLIGRRLIRDVSPEKLLKWDDLE